MNSLMKKAIATVAAAATALGLAAVTGATANAAGENATLTVSTSDAKFAGKTANAYKMFDADVTGSGSSRTVTYKLDDNWKTFFTTTTDGTSGAPCSDNDALDQCSSDYVKGLKDDALRSFAQKAAIWAQRNDIAAVTPAAKISDAVNNEGKYTGSFTGLDYGYYVVAVPGASVIDAKSQYASLVSVHEQPASVEIKGELPTVDKKVNDKDAIDAKIGQQLTFTLTSTIPDMTAYDSYTFNFVDTLSKGLTLVQNVTDPQNPVFEPTVTITDGTTTDTLTKDTDYTTTVDAADKDGNVMLHVNMKDFKAKHLKDAGKTITVTYKATLNENAIVGGTGNTNSASIHYTTNPKNTESGDSQPDTVRTYTYGFTIDKYTGTYGTNAKRLAGAKFQLQDASGAEIPVVQESAGSETEAAVYRVATSGETAATEIVTPNSGKLTFKGLANGKYLLEETEAPKEYNKLANKIGINIEGDNGKADPAKATVSVTYDNNAGADNYDQSAVEDAKGQKTIIPVKNESGVTLPGTGGMGTVAFTVVGVLIVAFGIAWAIRRKRA
ncbi:SpaH/EbpB family LPXTG-anchored major pilin [Bifidobacterium sp. 82T24]|uniref:SpaH/EbpB family LPXTG-anchored major pilin n=1 Tax=Bifidobacterium pluvialisilvae TaxID=2834436 RepID=UPI001C5896D7|nr:SpaH/EbpB family LPXTG-anchored major pilin [Bifidobacterium pluvialisilvae]MBW3089008.1 SpaH/EbpB family LPXTG-anchored major pilin [Bifidobacterium pluvialisilvae]